MKYYLKNDLIKLTVDSYAAEMHELALIADSINVLWQGDPKFWKGRNPTLFPQVGKPKSGTISFKGQDYQMGNHGFLRNSEFALRAKSETSLTLGLKANEATLSQYPYDFDLTITYSLKGQRVQITYRIINNDQEVMPFGFGLHPAFNCPLIEGECFEDYYLSFENEETITHNRKFDLKEHLFAGDATTIIKNPNSSFVTLCGGQKAVKVEMASFPYLAIWKKENAPFICIEPWLSPSGCFEDYQHKQQNNSIIQLDSQRELLVSYSIEII